MTNSIAQITVDDRFFEVAAAQSSRYGRLWTVAKETIQNSQDAGAKHINFGIDDDGEWVFIADDGPGMGPTGGIENFLTIGSSQKNRDESATGYFSTAKVRICFIHEDWEIRTNRQFLSKAMLGQRPIQELKHGIDGCQFALKSRNGGWDGTEVEDYVSLCNPEIRISLNGHRIKRTFRRGTLKAKFGWGEAYVNRGKKARLGTLIVRVNGLAMFTQSLPNVKAQVTIELDPAKSHHILQENREALVWKYREGSVSYYPDHEMREFVDGLIVNPSRAKPASKTVLEFVQGSQRALPTLKAEFGDDTTNGEALNSRTLTNDVKNAPQRVAVVDGGKALVASNTLTFDTLAKMLDDGRLEADRPGRLVQLVETEEWVWEGEDHIPDIRLEWTSTDTPMPLENKGTLAGGQASVVSSMPDTKASKFLKIFPYDYVIKHESNRPEMHTKHARVLAAWKSLLDIMSDLVKVSSNFGVGLCIDQGSLAEFVETDYGDFFLVDYRQFKSTGSQVAQTMKMLRLACHELVHARGYEDHNEAFINEETRIFNIAMENLSVLRASTKGLTVYSRGYGKK